MINKTTVVSKMQHGGGENFSTLKFYKKYIKHIAIGKMVVKELSVFLLLFCFKEVMLLE